MGQNETGAATGVGEEESKPRRIRLPRRPSSKKRTTHEQVRVAFDELKLGTEVSLEKLIARVEELRGRPIVIEQSDDLGPTGVCAHWISMDTEELIIYSPPHSELHRQQFILHELAHMVLRHEEKAVRASYAPRYFPHLDPERVRMVLSRENFDNEIEVAAELLADLFSAAIAASDREPGGFSEVFG